MKVRQVVQVSIMGTRRLYTYGWLYELGVVAPLAIGDKVEIPGNMVTEDGGAATVAAFGSDYNGPVKYIVRKIEERPADAGGLWEGFGDGDYA